MNPGVSGFDTPGFIIMLNMSMFRVTAAVNMARLSEPGGAGILAKTKCGSKEPRGALWGQSPHQKARLSEPGGERDGASKTRCR